MQRFDAKNLAAAHTQRELDMIEEYAQKPVDKEKAKVLSMNRNEEGKNA